MLNVFPFIVSTVVILGFSAVLYAYTEYSFEITDYLRAIIFIYIGGMFNRSMIDEIFYEHIHYTLEDFYQRDI